uniref:F-box/FBD/LRR-repeat protein At2g05300 isoform X2 n=1 Tax=Nicotiana tabacum TaxID=4097 RepID=A0A1S3X236_TOBAC|nr:PREDICTED: putative F-box/FBD/LRR-repeat protein At2g05300 isoform X2 [Nicotiana tabacum]
MEMQRKIMARGDRDRLSDLPDPILLDILSLLPEGKAVVRTSVLSQRWRFIWKSVTVSLDFEFPRCSSRKETLDRMASINRELHHWSFLQSSLDLETLVIDWSNYGSRHQYVLPWYKNKDEHCKRFEKIHNFNCSLLQMKTIKFINMVGPLSENKFVLPLIKYLLENATVLEKFIIAVGCKGYVSQDCVKLEQELLSFPRSSPHASVVFSYGPSLY